MLGGASLLTKGERMYQFNCAVCGKAATSMHSYARYCSKTCQSKAYKKTYYKKSREHICVCMRCDKEFVTTSLYKRYCSKKCMEATNKENIKKWRSTHAEHNKELKDKYSAKPENKAKKREKWHKDNTAAVEQSIASDVYYTPYTQEEDIYLLNNYDKLTKKELATALNRTISSVCSRHKKLINKQG
jgi:hypothetical protein